MDVGDGERKGAARRRDSQLEMSRRHAEFVEQFPYKSCRRGVTKAGEARAPWDKDRGGWRRSGDECGGKREVLNELRRKGIIGGKPAWEGPYTQVNRLLHTCKTI